jgi:hypothetical protein
MKNMVMHSRFSGRKSDGLSKCGRSTETPGVAYGKIDSSKMKSREM